MSKIFKNLFKTKNRENPHNSVLIQTSPLTEEQLSQSNATERAIYPIQFIMGSGQSIGCQRDHNEDALFTMTSVLADGKVGVPFGLCVIADGMGGHRNGEVASGKSVRTVVKYILDRVYDHLLESEPQPLQESLQEILEQSVVEAQKAVVRFAPGGGTTLTIALMLGGQVTIAHVGDSRAYFILPDSRLQKITKDHSLVQRLIDMEELTEEEAKVHPQKNVLLRAIGQPDPYRPDIHTYPIPCGGKLLLCSDGLWGVVSELELFKTLSKNASPTITCQELVDAANQAGGPDNISVIIVEFLGV